MSKGGRQVLLHGYSEAYHYSYKDLKMYKDRSLKIAMELGYSAKVLEKIRHAASIEEVDLILRSARKGD